MKTLFLSFCSKDTSIADLVDSNLKKILENQIKISRFERDVKYRDSFKRFMDTLTDHDFVLTIVSDSYLKSVPCLYEVGEVLKDHNYKDKLFFIVLSDEDEIYYSFSTEKDRHAVGANIYSIEERMEYLNYWKERNAETERIIGANSAQYRYMEEAEFAIQLKVSSYDLPVFLKYLNEARSIPLSEHIKNNFKYVIEQMYPELDLDKYRFKTLDKALAFYIQRISETTKTDYNQIILKGRSGSHSDAKFVVASDIAPHKQNYRHVAGDSEISHAIDYGIIVNLEDVTKSKRYMTAVLQTKSEIIIPIIVNGICVGAINSEAEQIGYYSDEIVNELISISDLLAISLSYLNFQVDMTKNELPEVSLHADC